MDIILALLANMVQGGGKLAMGRGVTTLNSNFKFVVVSYYNNYVSVLLMPM